LIHKSGMGPTAPKKPNLTRIGGGGGESIKKNEKERPGDRRSRDRGGKGL